jgi:hypothetical protein
MGRRALAAALLASLAACSRGTAGDERAPGAAPPASLDDPRALLSLDAGEVARRLGSFEWSGAAVFTATTQGDSAARVHVAERHRLRQLATGEFDVASEIDSGRGEGGLSGRRVIWAGGMTYAQGMYAPFRERPTDRGRDARRFREESFGLVADLARLYGPALAATPAGDVTLLGRGAHRFAFSLVEPEPVAAAPDRRVFAQGGPDQDTRRHLAFLDGRLPVAATGELLVDAETGAPLRARLTGAFGLKDDPRVRVQVDASGEIRALGDTVRPVTAPEKALPDERKPKGVADALEAAGLKAPPRKDGERAEPTDEEP